MANFVVQTSTKKGYKLDLQTGLFINNEFVAGAETIDVVNPAYGETICAVQAADKEQVDQAVDAAHKAFYGGWKEAAPQTRQKLMLKLADLMERDAEELAQIETLDNGKGISMSRNVDVPASISTIRYYAGYCDKIHGKVIDTPGSLSYTRHEAIGVVGCIIPWNFPLLMLAWKLGPALCTGNAIIVKSSELTPLSAIKIAALAKEAGFPPGVLNIITGYGPKAGDALARHTKVGKIAFTGSTLTGRHIMKAAAESNLKKVTLELGGKSPSIVFEDADLDQAIKWTHHGIYFNHGQCCCAGSRIYVQESIYDKFIAKFKEYAENTRVGDPEDETTFQGPQVSQTQYDRIMSYIETGKAEGATVFTGGERQGDKGYFIQPTVFTDVKQDMKIMQEEIFGPVVAIAKFKNLDDVIEKAHDTTYGLAASIHTTNVKTAIQVSNKLEAGTVWVNQHNVLHPETPFGGFRQSGFGRENGEYALENYLQVKCVKINIGADL
ncbi:aldehyde dehydrogenase [Hesseltinella vesiculosa]|uniref:Aldehyde dehydrogenase n=1 Tax=Hesseltinella vesiculosa TaxID=101127 RepID=A0A1X2G6X6_9FUNG|nr:aldehyde dehydrogenase [Hesseltinella vesiculosa]